MKLRPARGLSVFEKVRKQLLEFGKTTNDKMIKGHKIGQVRCFVSEGDENLNGFKMAYILCDLLRECEIYGPNRNNSCSERLSGATLAT